MSLGKRPATLERFGQVALAPGLVRAGEVIEPEQVAESIKQLWSGARFSSKRVILGVANQKVVVRQVDLPWMPDAELRSSLGFHVQEFIPMPVEEALLDFHALEEVVDPDGNRMLRVLLVAAMRSMVETHIQAAKLAGLRVEGVDLASFAVLRALTADPDVAMAGAAEVLVDIGASVTNIIVHAEGVPRFVRILLMGGDDVTEAVADRVGLGHDAAEVMKVELGLTSAGYEGPEGHPAAQAIGSTAAQLVEEVRGSIDYYLAQPNVERLGRVVLSGGGGRLTGLDAWLSAATRLPVERAEPFAGLRLGRVGLSPEQLEHVRALTVVPLGLAMSAA
jgi:type IV pilus assembly protein PilM